MSGPAKQIDPPRIEQKSELLIAGVSQRYTMETRANIPAQWQGFIPQIGNVSGMIGKASYGVCSNFGKDHSFDYLTGVEVSGDAKLPEGFTQIRIPARRYAIFTHQGNISTFAATIDGVWNRAVPELKLDVAEAPCLEWYGPNFNHETGADTEIWVPLKG
jgi:AraC family transcriptional regulator